MNRWTRFSLFVALNIAWAGAASAQETGTKADALSKQFFPIGKGYKWVYDYEGKDVTFEVVGVERKRGRPVYVVRRTIGKSRVEFKLSVAESGVYIHREGKKVFSPPLRQFAFLPRTGDTWTWRGKINTKPHRFVFTHRGMQRIKTPAGTFSAIKVYQKINESDHVEYWLAKGVGVVMLSGKPELVGGRRESFEWKLKRFHRVK